MKINSKVRAFTIVEVLVSMVISAVILGIIYVIFAIMTERMADYKNQNEPVSEMNRLMYILNKDIFESTEINLVNNALTFRGYNGREYKYFYSDSCLIRHHQSFIDTFQIRVINVSIDTIASGRKKVFKKLAIKSSVNDNEVNLKFYIRVYASQLINRQL